MSKFYKVIRKLLGGIVRRLYRVRVTGLENEPKEGPFIICANHLSAHDVVILSACIKNQPRYAAKAELFKIPIVGGLVKALGAFPLDRGGGDVSAIKKSIKMLEDGAVIGLFPQGHRYPGVNPRETEIKQGVGLLTAKTKVAVLPVSIVTKNLKMRFFRKTYITVGKPIDFSEYGELSGSRSDYEKISSHIFSRICDLADGTIATLPGKKVAGLLENGKEKEGKEK